MKATLTFDLSDVDDKESHLRATKALEMYLVLLKLDQMFRDVSRGKREKTMTPDEFFDLLNGYGIHLEELGS